jgi:hypothetical protein
MNITTGRPLRGGRLAFLLVIVLVVAVGVPLWLVRHHDEYVVPSTRPHRSAAPSEQSAAAAGALARLQQAIAERDTTAVSGPLLPAVVDNAATLGITGFTARYVAADSSADGAVAADGSWTADVALTWRFAGDPAGASEEVLTRFAPTASGVAVTGFTGNEGHRLPLWLTGPLTVRRTAEVTVAVAGGDSGAEADRYRALATRAVATVRRVVPWPRPHLVLDVPADESTLEQMMGAAPGSYHGVAAVTTSVDGSASGPVHVFVNPQVIGGLNSQGAQIVLSHEATHDATGVASNTTLPPWLLEGFADYVALRDVDLPLSTTAGQILAEVRTDGPPQHLPGPAEFNAQAEDFGAEYEAAWLACRLLAQRGGEQSLVHLYDEVKAGAAVGKTMRRDFGFGVAAFTKDWQRQLQRWAG